MLDILLVRHGQTKWNVEMRLQGTKDSDLTEAGIFQAGKLSERLAETEFSKVFAHFNANFFGTTRHKGHTNKTMCLI